MQAGVLESNITSSHIVLYEIMNPVIECTYNIVIDAAEEPKYSSLSYKSKSPAEKEERTQLKYYSKEIEIILLTVNDDEFKAALDFMSPPEKFFELKVYPKAGSVVGIFAKKKAVLIQELKVGNI